MKSQRKTSNKKSTGQRTGPIRYPTELILSSAGEGIYGLDATGKTTFINPAAEKMTGYSASEMIGDCQHRLVHHSKPDGSPYPQVECPIYSAFRKGEIYQTSDEVFWRKDGTSFPVEYVSTPIWEKDKLVGAVVIFKDITERKIAEEKISQLQQRLELENAYLKEEFRESTSYGDIIGNSPALANIIRQIEMVAPTGASVLIIGESGTGKELVAREIHKRSERMSNPLIKVNCASIPRELYESEFFGHVKGSFTGAIRDRAGRFELADGGTIFLDEVGEIPLDLQSKLLRVLQEGTYERIGDEKTRKVDVRIIAATNRDLKQLIETKSFRQDLYYRLNVFPIEVPPLRKRKEDIPVLADQLLKLACQKIKRDLPNLTKANVMQLQNYDWPGNVRELQNVLERSAILWRKGRLKFDLPTEPLSGKLSELSPSQTSPEEVKEVQTHSEMKIRERNNIINALECCRWKVAGPGGAAELMGIKSSTLESKIKKLRIKKRRPEFPSLED